MAATERTLRQVPVNLCWKHQRAAQKEAQPAVDTGCQHGILLRRRC